MTDPKAAELDPQPFALISPGVFGVRSAILPNPSSSAMGWEWIFAPGHTFSQNREDYEK